MVEGAVRASGGGNGTRGRLEGVGGGVHPQLQLATSDFQFQTSGPGLPASGSRLPEMQKRRPWIPVYQNKLFLVGFPAYSLFGF